MRTLKRTVLVLALLAGCGQQLVEFANPSGTSTSAPTVTLTDPVDAATSVVVNKKISATFSKAMDPASITVSSFKLNRGANAVAGALTYAGTTAIFTPSGDLSAGTIYSATITTGAKDASGNAIQADYLWSFTTAGFADVTPPTVIVTSPSNNANNVSTGKRVTATFSEGMDPTTITSASFTVKQGAASVPGNVTYDVIGQRATFVPASPLALNTLFTATITTGAKDTAGNALLNDYVWSFTTGACGQAPVALASAGAFAVLAGSTVTNTGNTIVTGDLGVSPGTAVTGFGPGVVNGSQHAGDPTAAQGIADLNTAYLDAAGRSLCPVTVAGNLGGQTLAPGLYKSTSTLAISSGDLTLDAGGDGDAVFIFQMASSFTTTAGRAVILSGGAKATNVFWQVGSSATLGTTSAFVGTIMADLAITLNTGATLDGRALAHHAAVALDSNTVTVPAP